ncbi:MAG: hypothetical protein ABIR18_02140, partial [Chitinophagaceae bacterium]
MKKNLLVFTLLFAVLYLKAQEPKLKISINAELVVPTYAEIPSMGIGGAVNADYLLSRKVSAALTVGYDHFYGNVFDVFTDETIHGFSILPVMVGVKYYFPSQFYISGQGGMVVGLKHAGNAPALSPGIGMLLPVNGKRKIDIGLKFTGVLSQ